MTAQARIRPVILSGGAGTRLWPVSRLGRPKQLLSLTDGATLLQATAARVADPASFAPLTLVAREEHAGDIEAQLAAAGIAVQSLYLEPVPRNTAPAVAIVALAADEDDLLLVLPSDHDVRDPAAFLAAVEAGRAAAEDGWLVTFGSVPDRPETGYGYVRVGAPLGTGAFRADRFAEKPPRETAELYLSEGGWLWNTGIFLFRAGAMAQALAEHAADVHEAVRLALIGAGEGSAGEDGAVRHRLGSSFAGSPAESIDRAVLEKSRRVAVVPVEMGWSDIGSWDAVHALGPHDGFGNMLSGDVVAPGSRDCLVRSEGPVVVALGVSDLVIVATERAVLVVPRGETQRVQEAMKALEARRGRLEESE